MSTQPFSSDNGFITDGNVTANLFIGDGSQLTNLPGGTGNVTIVDTTISAPAGDPLILQSLDGGGIVRDKLLLNGDDGITRLSSWSEQDSNTFTSADWTTGQYTSGGPGGLITFTGAVAITQFLDNNPYIENLFWSVNGGALIPNDGYGYNPSGDITFNVTIPPAVDPTTVNTFEIYYQYESKIEIDQPDSEEFLIQAINIDLQLETRQNSDIQIDSSRNLSMRGTARVDIRNDSNTQGIQIRTDVNDSDYTWDFGVDGNLTAPGNIATTANVTAGFFIGDGSQLTGLPAGYANADVFSYLGSNSNVVITTTGDVTANAFIGDGSQLSNITGASIVGNVANAITAETVTTNAQPNITSVGTLDSLAVTGNADLGNISASGQVVLNGVTITETQLTTTGASFEILGTDQGVQLQSLDTANSTFALVFADNTGAGLVTDAGEIIVGIDGNVTVTDSMSVGGELSTTGNITTTANVTAGYFIGDGSQLTGLPAGYANADVFSYLGSNSNVVITTTGNITGATVAGDTLTTGNITVTANVISSTDDTIFIDPAGGSGSLSGNVIIQGNLQVNGTTTTVDSNVVSINDLVINVANNASTSSLANGGGLGVGPIDSEYATLLYASVPNEWQMNVPLNAPALGNTSTVLNGDGGNISNITGANVTGTVSSANTAFNVSGANVTGTVGSANTAFSVGGANVTGTVSSATTAATVTTNAQPNITSVGTLSSLSVTGNVTAGNIVSSGTFQAATISSSSIAIPYSNTFPYTANVITLNGNTLWRSNSNIAANTPFAVGNTANTWSMVQQWTKAARIWYVDPLNGLDTNDGSDVSPLKTIARAAQIIGGSGLTMALYPGTYNETITWTDANVNIVGIGLGSAVRITGTFTVNLTTSPASSVRISGVRFTNLVMTGTGGGLYLDTCIIDQFTQSGSGSYVEFTDCDGENGNVAVTGAVAFTVLQGNLNRLQVGNANAVVTVQDTVFTAGNVVVTAGTLLLNNTIMVAAAANTNVITSSAGTAVYIAYTGINTSAGTLGRISLAGFYSLICASFDPVNSTLTGIPIGTPTYADSLVSLTSVTAVSGNVTGGNIVTGGRVVATGNVSGGNLITTGLVSATGNVTGGNLVTVGRVVATGNVSGNFFIGNGSQLTGITASISGNLAGNLLANGFFINNLTSLSVTGNVTGGNLITTGNISGGNLSLTGRIDAPLGNALFGNITTPGIVGATGNIQGGNLVTAGNVTGNFFIGDGSLLTNLPAGSYSNTNVTSLLSSGAFTGNIIPNGNSTQSLGNATNQWKDIWVSNATIYLDSIPLSVSNVGALQFNGNDIVTSGANVVNTGNLSTTGNVVGGNVVISAGGTLTFADGSTQSSAYGNANVFSYLGSNSNVAITTTGNITGAFISGNGSQLTGITASISGNLAGNLLANGFFINNLTSLGVTGNITGGNLISTGNISGGNLSLTGRIDAPFGNALVGNITTPGIVGATGNIQGGNLVTSGNVTGNFILGNISQATGLGNISVINLNGNVSTVLAGDGTFVAQSGGGGTYGDANVSTYLASGNNTGGFDSLGNISLGGISNTTFLGSRSSTPTTVTLSFNSTVTPAPFATGDKIVVEGGSGVDGTWTVLSGTTDDVTFSSNLNPGPDVYTDLPPPTVSLLSISTVTATGTITGGAFTTSGTVTATEVNASNFNTTGNVVAGLVNTLRLTVTGTTNLNNIGNITITGGNAGEVLTTNGSGNLSWTRSVSVGTMTSGANVTPSVNNTQYNVTALAESATVLAPTGTPVDGQKLTIRIEDNGTGQTLSWNAIYRVIGTTLPTTTVATKVVYVGCIYNAQDTTWDVVSVAQQA